MIRQIEPFLHCPRCALPLHELEHLGEHYRGCSICNFWDHKSPVPIVNVLVPICRQGTKTPWGLVLIENESGLNLPGGYLDQGEHPEEAGIREVEEETGLRVKTDRLLGMRSYKPLNYLVFYYLSRSTNHTPVAGSDAKAVHVFPLEQIPWDRFPEGFDNHQEIIREWIDSIHSSKSPVISGRATKRGDRS